MQILDFESMENIVVNELFEHFDQCIFRSFEADFISSRFFFRHHQSFFIQNILYMFYARFQSVCCIF